MTSHHLLEISNSCSPCFSIARSESDKSNELSTFELSLLCGVMVHPASTFSVETETSSVSIEWQQDYIV
jgi:hypothetical protein